MSNFIKEYVIRTFDLDCMNRLSLKSLLGMLEETAFESDAKVGLNSTFFTENNINPEIVNFCIKIFKYPTSNDFLRVETWISSIMNNKIRREFIVRDSYGNIWIQASGAWIFVTQYEIKNDHLLLEYLRRHTVRLEKVTKLNFKYEDNIKHWKYKGDYFTRTSDLGSRLKFNIFSIADSIIDCLPIELYTQKNITSFEFNIYSDIERDQYLFIKSAVVKNEDEDSLIHLIMDKQSEVILATAKTIWNE